MIGRLAWRSLTAHPIRALVLATGFGAGVAVMALLLGVAEVVLRQAQSPALAGGGDILIRLTPQVPAPIVISGILQSDALRTRIRVAAPFHATDLYLLNRNTRTRIDARGGIPSLERALGDPETSAVTGWTDTEADAAWTHASPESALRSADRFHTIPDAPVWENSWAEWLYFNGQAGGARFYLTFLVGPRVSPKVRTAGIRLQLERNGRMETYGSSARISDEQALQAPDLTIGQSSVRLEGLRYHIQLDLTGQNKRRVTGHLTIEAVPGRLIPPIEILGARGWRTGYVVPVMAGTLDGTLNASGETVSLNGGSAYHDHNWGFWRGVSWQWGQVQHGDLSLLYGRVFPPPEAADPERLPGFVGVLGPDGPLGYARNVRIAETNDTRGRPRTIEVRAEGTGIDVTLRFDVTSAETTRMTAGPLANNIDFLQLQGQYTVSGKAGGRTIDFVAPGAAETFRGTTATRLR